MPAESLVQLVAVGLDQPGAEREHVQQQLARGVRHHPQVGARERGEQTLVDVLREGGGHAARQHEDGARRHARKFFGEHFQRFARDVRAARVDLRLFLSLDLDVDARLPGDADKIRLDAARFQLAADDLADVARDKARRDGRDAEILQHRGDVDALAAGGEGGALRAVQPARGELPDPQHIVERGVECYRVDHDRSAFSGAAGRTPCSRRYSSKTAAAVRQMCGQGRRA